jgi:hypothetical protein
MRASKKRVHESTEGSSDQCPSTKPRVYSNDERLYGKTFRHDLINEWSLGKLDSKQLCKTAFFHTRAGGCGLDDLAVDPNMEGDNHARKVRQVLRVDETHMYTYEMLIPLWSQKHSCRVISKFAVRLPHELIARDFTRRPWLYNKASMDPDDYITKRFLDHPIVRAEGADDVYPIGHYTDKVRLGQSDSFWRGSVNCTFVRDRLTCWVLRASDACRCGCNARCSLDPIQIVMNKSLNLLQRKIHMMKRFDNLPWFENDLALRAKLANSPLPIRGACTEIRADMPERHSLAAIKHLSWCMACAARPTNFHTMYHECSLHSLPWEKRDHGTYIEQVRSNVIKVRLLSDREKTELVSKLSWKMKYPWGRTFNGTSSFGLQRGDRVIIGGDLESNPHDIEKLRPPCTVWFFRPSSTSPCVGVPLIFHVPGVHSVGIDHLDITYFADCVLHTIDLGLSQRFVALSFRDLLQRNVFGLQQTTLLGRLYCGMDRLRALAKQFYREHNRTNSKKITRMKSWTLGKLGHLDKPCLKAKGAETKALVKFTNGLLREHVEKLGPKGNLLLAAGSSLVEYYDLIYTEHRHMSLSSRQRLMNAAINFLVAYRSYGGHMVPKHHSLVHLTQDSNDNGNPSYFSTYQDEHDNGVIAAIGGKLSPTTFYNSLWERLEVFEKFTVMIQ